MANGLFAKAVSVVRSSETTDAVYSDGDTTTYPTVLYAFREDGSCIVTNCATGKVIQKVKKGDGRLTFTADQEPVPAAVTEPVPAAAPVPEPVPAADPVTQPALESSNVVAAAVAGALLLLSVQSTGLTVAFSHTSARPLQPSTPCSWKQLATAS